MLWPVYVTSDLKRKLKYCPYFTDAETEVQRETSPAATSFKNRIQASLVCSQIFFGFPLDPFAPHPALYLNSINCLQKSEIKSIHSP